MTGLQSELEKKSLITVSHSQLVSEGVACSRKSPPPRPPVTSLRPPAGKRERKEARKQVRIGTSGGEAPISDTVAILSSRTQTGRDKALCFEFRHPCAGVRTAALAGRAAGSH